MKDTLNLRVPATAEVFEALRSERDAALRDLAAAHVVNRDFLDALAAARAERDDLKHDMERLQTANSEQLAELEAARKDAERLDWLDKTSKESGCGFGHLGYGEYRYYAHRWYAGTEYQLARAVIDAAMRQEKP